jgi:hypothetical protein
MKRGFYHKKNLLWLFYVLFIAVFGFFLVSFLAKDTSRKNDFRDKDNIAQAILDKCMKTGDSSSCYSVELGKVVNARSLADAITVLKKVQEKDIDTLYCHFIAHKVTRAAVLKDPENWLDLFSQIDMAGCSNGYFHGILEGYLYKHPEFVLNATSIEKICSQIQPAASDELERDRAPGNCGHAVGHILLVESLGEIDRALVVCSSLKHEFKYPCFRGVFMETTERETLVMHEISEDLVWDKKNTLEIQELCSTFNEDIKRACLQSLAPMYATISEGNYEMLYEYCQSQRALEDKELCFIEGAGYMAFLLAREIVDTPNSLPQLCKPLFSNTQSYRSCVRGVTSYIINGSPRFIDKLHSFCSYMESQEARLCYKEVATQLSNRYGKSTLKSFCDNAPSEYKTTCTDNAQKQTNY